MDRVIQNIECFEGGGERGLDHRETEFELKEIRAMIAKCSVPKSGRMAGGRALVHVAEKNPKSLQRGGGAASTIHEQNSQDCETAFKACFSKPPPRCESLNEEGFVTERRTGSRCLPTPHLSTYRLDPFFCQRM